MNKINTLTSITGRKLLHEAYKELRYSRQRSSIGTLAVLWRICTQEKNLNKYINKDIEIAMPLGFKNGTALWMEEIVNRFYFSSINSFVYLGAAILLVIIGLRRFDENISLTLVFGGIIFESVMLFFMFIVMLFTPNEEIMEEDEDDLAEDLITEIGEIGRDFAAAVVQLEMITEKFSYISDNQMEIMNKLSSIATSQQNMAAPNPEMLIQMRETNLALESFKTTINELNSTAQKLKSEEIEFTVKKELEKIITKRISSNE